MTRTTVMLPDDVAKRLRLEARRRGVSMATLVREAVEAKFPEPERKPLSFVALGRGGPLRDDMSNRTRELAGEAMEADYERQQREYAEYKRRRRDAG
ncbi:MAG: ribbon-helix-helix protein, CopG family [Acidimicrobiales bacterium]